MSQDTSNDRVTQIPYIRGAMTIYVMAHTCIDLDRPLHVAVSSLSGQKGSLDKVKGDTNSGSSQRVHRAAFFAIGILF